MRVQFHFRHLDASEALQALVRKQIELVGSSLIGDSHWQVTVGKDRYKPEAGVEVQSSWGFFRASAQADGYSEAVLLALEKIGRQIQKQKDRLQDHKKWELSKRGKMQHVTPELEFDPTISLKKSA